MAVEVNGVILVPHILSWEGPQMSFCKNRKMCLLVFQFSVILCLLVVMLTLIHAASVNYLSDRMLCISLNATGIAAGFVVALSLDRWRRSA